MSSWSADVALERQRRWSQCDEAHRNPETLLWIGFLAPRTCSRGSQLPKTGPGSIPWQPFLGLRKTTSWPMCQALTLTLQGQRITRRRTAQTLRSQPLVPQKPADWFGSGPLQRIRVRPLLNEGSRVAFGRFSFGFMATNCDPSVCCRHRHRGDWQLGPYVGGRSFGLILGTAWGRSQTLHEPLKSKPKRGQYVIHGVF